MSNVLLYRMVVEGFDFGPFITKLVIAWDKGGSVNAADFSLTVTKQGGAFDDGPVVEGERKVTGAYMAGGELTLELEVHPSYAVANGFRIELKDEGPGRHYIGNQWAHPYKHTLTYKGETFELERTGVVMPLADSFERPGPFIASDGTRLQYASFVPSEAKSGKRPLVIWLHGAGEGSWMGTQDINVALIGNKVVSFADKKFQDAMGGAYVLVPQAPTMWMDDGTKTYTQDGTTMYETALTELLERYIEDHPNVDRGRVFIGGCSNGGFMTVRMILTRPELFAAAFPVCQAYKPEWISDGQVEKIAHLPIWQVHARNDEVVPFAFAEDLHGRLIKAGGKDVRYTWYDTVEDVSGLWVDDGGKSWEYNGHFCWVHVFNGDVLCEGVSLFEWLGSK